jgi:hypothetical protein
MAPTASTEDAISKNLVDQIYDRILGLLSDRIWTGAENLSDAILQITRDVLMPFTGMAGAPGGRGGLDDGWKAWDQRPGTTERA